MEYAIVISNPLAEQAKPFLDYLDEWLAGRSPLPLSEAAADPQRAAIISIDVINGFCYGGPLSSPRVAAIVEPIAGLFERAWQRGVRQIVLSQEQHEPDAVEFSQYPAHCVRGTWEAETVDAFKQLPFFGQLTVFGKNSINPWLSGPLGGWLAAHPELDTFIITGDCTDLCTYQLAMHLRLDANERQLNRRVIVPSDCVQTYDRPVEAAREQGGLPHSAALMHAVFLYHMQLNGIEVVSTIA
jgi:nicotinamidase-related amidase